MKSRSTMYRLRRSWRVARREVTGAARALPELARLERPGHARGRRPVDWDLSERPYRRAVTPLAFAVLFLGAIIGSYWAASGGHFTGHGAPSNAALPVTATPAPTVSPSASTPPAVTVLPVGPVPSTPGTPTPRKPHPATTAPARPTATGCGSCATPTPTSSTAPSVDPSLDPSQHASVEPVPSGDDGTAAALTGHGAAQSAARLRRVN